MKPKTPFVVQSKVHNPSLLGYEVKVPAKHLKSKPILYWEDQRKGNFNFYFRTVFTKWVSVENDSIYSILLNWVGFLLDQKCSNE